MQPFACERIEEPGRIADQQPTGAGATRDAMTEWPGSFDGIATSTVPPVAGVVAAPAATTARARSRR